MSKIVFFCIPAHGHTNPTLGVVRELVSQGHQVWYYSYNAFREKIEGAGAVFISCDSFDQELRLSPEEAARLGQDMALSARVLAETTLALDETICRHMKELRPDCIVADSMAIWGKAAALKLGIPFVSSTTTFAFNRDSAKIMKQDRPPLLSLLISMIKAQKQVNRLRKKGYPFRNMLDIISNAPDTHTIVYTSRQFQPAGHTFGDCYSFVGPSIRPVQEPFRKTGDTLVYISMGTVCNDRLPLYRNCVEAFRGSSCQVVISIGDSVDPSLLGPLPSNIQVFPHVDQMAVLQKADVFLSHCGMNSVNESLYFGVPLLMLPQTTEQKGVARRVEQVGAGLFLPDTAPGTIRSAAETLLTEPSFRQKAQNIAQSFRLCSGAKGAAWKILSVCER